MMEAIEFSLVFTLPQAPAAGYWRVNYGTHTCSHRNLETAVNQVLTAALMSMKKEAQALDDALRHQGNHPCQKPGGEA